MKRWLVILLVALAVIILVSPGIVGRFAEKNLEQDIEWVESESAGIEFQSESFDRGWFTSEGRHRVVLSGATFRERLRNYQNKTGNEDLPTLIIDTHLDQQMLTIFRTLMGDPDLIMVDEPTEGLAPQLVAVVA